jgi:hypothetical protein
MRVDGREDWAGALARRRESRRRRIRAPHASAPDPDPSATFGSLIITAIAPVPAATARATTGEPTIGSARCFVQRRPAAAGARRSRPAGRRSPANARECTLSMNPDNGLFFMNSDFVFHAAHEKYLHQIFLMF